MIITAEFSSVHISHTELYQMGQPTLARYPLHWHVCGDIGWVFGENFSRARTYFPFFRVETLDIGPDRYEDPSTFEYNSIHESYSRWVTVHATNNAQVKNLI